MKNKISPQIYRKLSIKICSKVDIFCIEIALYDKYLGLL